MSKKKSKTVYMNYPNVASMRIDLLETEPSLKSNQRTMNRAVFERGNGQQDWLGLDNYQEVLDAVKFGNERLTKKLTSSELYKKLPTSIGANRQRFRSDAGDELDIHAVNKGDLSRAWSAHKKVVKRARAPVRIIIDIGANCNVSASVLRTRGIAGAGLAMALESAGYSVSVSGAFAASNFFESGGGITAVFTVQIKPFAGRITPSILASTVCLSGFFRTYGFAGIIHAADREGREVDDGLGRTKSVEGELEPDPAYLTFVVPSTVECDTSARKWIDSTVQLIKSGSIAA